MIDDFVDQIVRIKMNWIFMIDTSGSMGPDAIDPNGLIFDVKNAIRIMLNEIVNFSEANDICSQVRIMTFSDQAVWKVGSRELSESVKNAVAAWENCIIEAGGGTNTADAINEARSVLSRWYLGDGPNTMPILVLVSDGLSNDPQGTSNAIDLIKKVFKGRTLRISLGLRYPEHHELEEFATRGTIENEDGSLQVDVPYYFFVEDSENLVETCKWLASEVFSILFHNHNLSYPITCDDEAVQWSDDDWENL